MAGQVELSRDIRVASEECFYKALSSYLEGWKYLERRLVYDIVVDDDNVQEGTKGVMISEPIDDSDDCHKHACRWSIHCYHKQGRSPRATPCPGLESN